MKTMATLPKHGCARCEWWRKAGDSPWRICGISGERRWYQHGPCDEYEMDPTVPNEIELDL